LAPPRLAAQHLLLQPDQPTALVRQGKAPRRRPGAATAIRGRDPRPRLDAVRVVDMSGSNLWAELAASFRRTQPAPLEHDITRGELKRLVPADAKEAIGHGLRAKCSRSGAVSFDLLEPSDAGRQ
jgi:hypothetical protein